MWQWLKACCDKDSERRRWRAPQRTPRSWMTFFDERRHSECCARCVEQQQQHMHTAGFRSTYNILVVHCLCIDLTTSSNSQITNTRDTRHSVHTHRTCAPGRKDDLKGPKQQESRGLSRPHCMDRVDADHLDRARAHDEQYGSMHGLSLSAPGAIAHPAAAGSFRRPL